MKSRIGLLLALTTLLTAGCITHVDAGNVGVEINSCSGGGIEPAPLGVGYHTTGPCTSIVEFPAYQQTFVLTKSEIEGKPHDESINVTSSEGLPISIDVSLSFTPIVSKVPAIYAKYKKDLEEIESIYMRQMIRVAAQDTFAKYTAQQLYTDKKESARAEIEKMLVDKLSSDGFSDVKFTINETRPPHEVVDAIKAKVAMTQLAQQAQQAVQKATFDGQAVVAKANADASARRAAADAEAYANQKIASSLSSVLVRYEMAKKWDGRMSQVEGAGGNILFNLKD